MNRLLIALLAFFVPNIVLAASADDLPPIATDRPGNGNAATVVPSGHLQVEWGGLIAWDYRPEPNLQRLTFPTFLRFGIGDWAEARLSNALVGIELLDNPNIDRVRATDTSLGVKFALLKQAGAAPDLALMVDVFFETGTGPFSNDAVVPEVRLAAAWPLPAGFGLLLNFGVDFPDSADGRFARGLYVVNLGYTIPAFGDRLSVFVESFGLVDFEDIDRSVIQIDAGMAFLLNNDWQLDLFTQHPLSDAALQFQGSLGVSHRF